MLSGGGCRGVRFAAETSVKCFHLIFLREINVGSLLSKVKSGSSDAANVGRRK